MRARVMDAELAALLWVLLDVRTPIVVAGNPGTGRTEVRDALVGALPDDVVCLGLAGPGDDLGWLPQAPELGWRADGPPGRSAGGDAPPRSTADPRTGVLVVDDLADGPAGGPDGERARILVRALALGYGMLATMPADDLASVFEHLGAPAVGADADERSRLGAVLVMAPAEPGRGHRVAAAHYVRPVALDAHGHVQRLPPAVLATWNGTLDRWDHFAWGVMDELAGRLGRAPRDVEREQARRAAALGR